MPTLGVKEKQPDFVSRCVKVRQAEHPGEDNKQSVAICYSMYKDQKKSEVKK